MGLLDYVFRQWLEKHKDEPCTAERANAVMRMDYTTGGIMSEWTGIKVDCPCCEGKGVIHIRENGDSTPCLYCGQTGKVDESLRDKWNEIIGPKKTSKWRM